MSAAPAAKPEAQAPFLPYGRQVIEDDDIDATGAEGTNNVRTDVSGTTGNEASHGLNARAGKLGT